MPRQTASRRHRRSKKRGGGLLRKTIQWTPLIDFIKNQYFKKTTTLFNPKIMARFAAFFLHSFENTIFETILVPFLNNYRYVLCKAYSTYVGEQFPSFYIYSPFDLYKRERMLALFIFYLLKHSELINMGIKVIEISDGKVYFIIPDRYILPEGVPRRIELLDEYISAMKEFRKQNNIEVFDDTDKKMNEVLYQAFVDLDALQRKKDVDELVVLQIKELFEFLPSLENLKKTLLGTEVLPTTT